MLALSINCRSVSNLPSKQESMNSSLGRDLTNVNPRSKPGIDPSQHSVGPRSPGRSDEQVGSIESRSVIIIFFLCKEKSVIEKAKKLAKTQGELEELEEIIKEKKKLLREKSKLSKSLESDLQSHRAKMRRLAYEADLFSDRLTQVNDSMIDWKQIIGIDELVKQGFTVMELILFLVGALLPLLLILLVLCGRDDILRLFAKYDSIVVKQSITCKI
ncbi:hypothetical protein SADUNF_Sadunf09G0126600 [Salix dunnii]|uniref:Uncharacterized protein n=1 Tax=Salix dunnii TaxID=1413687 RepID=A0A835JX59_9ROSI|nr:hypothetical protein SADUNF_Sadunf09G0126600 [Salix dunnii]